HRNIDVHSNPYLKLSLIKGIKSIENDNRQEERCGEHRSNRWTDRAGNIIADSIGGKTNYEKKVNKVSFIHFFLISSSAQVNQKVTTLLFGPRINKYLRGKKSLEKHMRRSFRIRDPALIG